MPAIAPTAGSGVVVGPGEVCRVAVPPVAHRPVARRDALVRAQRLSARRLQMLECDVGSVDVIPCRQTSFEKQDRAAGVGQQHTVEFDRDVTVGTQRIDPRVRVARMAVDRFVLLEPVQTHPIRTAPVRRTGAVAVVEHPRRRRRGAPARTTEKTGTGRTAPCADALVAQKPGTDIRQRNVVLRVVRHLPHVTRRGGVEDQFVVDEAADPPWRGSTRPRSAAIDG